MSQVIRTTPIKRLEDTLARAVTADPGLAPARALLLHPLRLLDALGRDAGPALQDDGAAIERTRLLLSQAAISVRELLAAIAGPQHEPGLANEIMIAMPNADEEGIDDLEGQRDPTRFRLCPGALLDLSALVLIGLAAARVGRRLARDNVAVGFVATVEALAIAALPAESLAQALDDGLDEVQLVAMLGAVRTDHSARLAALAPLFLDRVEEARFHAIKFLFAQLRADAGAQWDSTFDHSIRSVERIKSDARLKVRLDAGDNESTNALLDRLTDSEKGTAKFVFVTDTGEILERSASRIRKENDFAEVELPPRALPGWFGIATDEDKTTARAHRTRIRRKWIKLDNRPPLRIHSIEVDRISIPEAGRALPPPRSPAACWGADIVTVELRQADQAKLSAYVRTQVELGFDRSIERGRVSYQIGTFVSEPIEVSGKTASFELEPEWVVDGAELRVLLFVGDSQVPDHISSRTIAITTELDQRTVALVCFTFASASEITRVSDEQRAALMSAATRADARLRFIELPWIADGDLLSHANPHDRSQAASEVLLGRLAALAGRTPGIEGAALIGLLPGDGKHGQWQPAEAAEAIGVATAAALGDLLASILAAPARVADHPRRCLRVIGEISSKRISLTEPVRVEQRTIGLGAPHASPFVAVLCDGDGIELARTVITTHNPAGFGSFVALLELPDAARRLEIHAGETGTRGTTASSPLARMSSFGLNVGAVLERGLVAAAPTPKFGTPRASVDRPQGELVLQLRKSDPGALQWTYLHTQGVPATIEIEVGRDGIWSRVMRLTSKVERVALDLDDRPLGPAPTHLRVVASDGWNTAATESIELGELGPGKALLIRAAGAERYYVEGSAASTELRWGSADDDSFVKTLSRDGLLKLPPRLRAASLLVGPQLED